MRKITLSFFVIFLLWTSSANAFEPIAPSKQVNSQIQKKEVDDLPYKILAVEKTVIKEGDDDEEDTVTIDWSKLPFIPSKTPQLKPSGDPSY